MEGPKGLPVQRLLKKTLTHVFSTSVVLILHRITPFLKLILEPSKRPRLEVGHQGPVFQHPGANAGVPLQQLMPTAQGKARWPHWLFPLRVRAAKRPRGPASGGTHAVAAVQRTWFLGLGHGSELWCGRGQGPVQACHLPEGAMPLFLLGILPLARQHTPWLLLWSGYWLLCLLGLGLACRAQAPFFPSLCARL